MFFFLGIFGNFYTFSCTLYRFSRKELPGTIKPSPNSSLSLKSKPLKLLRVKFTDLLNYVNCVTLLPTAFLHSFILQGGAETCHLTAMYLTFGLYRYYSYFPIVREDSCIDFVRRNVPGTFLPDLYPLPPLLDKCQASNEPRSWSRSPCPWQMGLGQDMIQELFLRARAAKKVEYNQYLLHIFRA